MKRDEEEGSRVADCLDLDRLNDCAFGGIRVDYTTDLSVSFCNLDFLRRQELTKAENSAGSVLWESSSLELSGENWVTLGCMLETAQRRSSSSAAE